MSEVKINSSTLQVAVADDNQERARGLCCRDFLPVDEGMLFVYNQPGDYGFWMKDTWIPLDMLWISSDKNVVHIEHSVQPESYPETFHSPQSAQYILETNAGWAKNNDVRVGDIVSF